MRHVLRDKKLMRNESISVSESEIPCVIVKKGYHNYAKKGNHVYLVRHVISMANA